MITFLQWPLWLTIFNPLVKFNQPNLDITFKALADVTRREILARLSHGDALVTELAEPFAMSFPAISKHLRVLEKAGLISKKKLGRERVCHLEAGFPQTVASWTEFYQSFWDVRLDTLAQTLDRMATEDKEHGK